MMSALFMSHHTNRIPFFKKAYPILFFFGGVLSAWWVGFLHGGKPILAFSVCDTLFEGSVHEKLAKVYSRPTMIYVGSSGLVQPGFVSFNQSELDLLKEEDFATQFCPHSVDVFFSEHTFEHIAAGLYQDIFKRFLFYLKSGGYIRLAIPTFPPDHSPGDLDIQYGHISFYTAPDLVNALEKSGFVNVTALEYKIYENRRPVRFCTAWFDSCGGRVRRSVRHDNRNLEFLNHKWASLDKNQFNELASFCGNYTPGLITSTIVEGFKP